MGLFAELRRRNVFRVGLAYAIASWVILQVVDVVAPILKLPEWFPTSVFAMLAVGFVPALIFAWAFELTPEGLKKEQEVDRTESITHVTGRKLDYAIIAVLSVGILLLLVDRFTQPEAVAVTAGEKSIAVLPFVDMSPGGDQEYFSDGITEEILNALASVDELLVAGRTSSFAFKGRNEDPRTIGDTLGVEHILEGSVRKSGDTLRITAQLIRVDNGFHLWSGTYDRKLEDVFAIQDDIAGEILEQIKAELVTTRGAEVVAGRTDTQAYERYLLAKQRITLRTTPGLESAAALLDEALAVDPEYAPALAQRGIATLLLSELAYGPLPKEKADARGLEFIERALAVDADLAEGWAALGLYHGNRPGEHDLAIDALTKALEINPNLINARNWLHIALLDTGDLNGAIEVLEDLLERDPLFKPGIGNAVNLYVAFGRHGEVVDHIEEHWSGLAGFAAQHPRDYYGYGEMMELAVAFRAVGKDALADEALGYVERAIAEQLEVGIDHMVLDLRRAELHAFRGETEKAFEMLRDAAGRGLLAYPDIAMGWNGMRDLRDDPRMLEIDRTVAGNVNAQRSILGLDPIQARNGAWREPLSAAPGE